MTEKLYRVVQKDFQDKEPNFRDENGNLYLFRCYLCNRENWAPAVATGTCANCGYKDGAS